MSNFPLSFDDDATLPFVNDNLTEIGGEAINAVRDAVFNIEQYLGLGADGSTGSVATRLGISLNPDGTIKPSAIASLGLVVLPITNGQIAPNAEIHESKLKLDHRTQDLFNYITDLANGVNTSLGWIGVSGSKLEPHLLGLAYRHTLDQLDVTNNPALLLKNRFRTFRNNTNGFTVIDDMNDELLAHQFADGSATVPATLITTNDGSTFPATHAHPASGIFLTTSRFSTIPQTATDLQLFADYIDSASIFLLGTRIQNLYSNGISRASRSSNLVADGYGQFVVPVTSATAYLLNNGTSSSPFDNINTGDDIIEFKPTATEMSSNSFDAKFALVKVGDIIRMNYGGVEVPFIIKEKKYIQSGGNKKYLVRIDGKNFKYTTDGYARIDKPLFNINKYGALAMAAANNNFSELGSLILINPTSAMALGVNFTADLLDNTHYNLYLVLYPNGNPDSGFTILPPIDVTGNLGATPGKYTLESVVETVNTAFRQPGYNYRLVAFSYQGEFGIALADSYNNAGFSIISGVIDSTTGAYDQAQTNLDYPNNVVGLFASVGFDTVDPLGFGPTNANIASPEYSSTYATPAASQTPTKLFVPLRRNNYYVNGVEKDKFALEPEQLLDGYGDGYWPATIISKNIIPGISPIGRVEVTYRVPYDLDNSGLNIGKTIVVQSLGEGGLIDFGRFIINDVSITCAPNIYTDITVYDAVHATGLSPSNNTLADGYSVAIYFSPDSVYFNRENSSDINSVTPFKRNFEVYVDQEGKTFSHERARINISGGTLTVNTVPLYTYSELAKLNIIKISNKLRGYQFGSVTKITLRMLTLSADGSFSGYLCEYDGANYTKQGPLTLGKIGQTIRFYDETNVDYIDIFFDANVSVSAFADQVIDFQLFPTLSLDQEIMLIGTCQVNDTTKIVNYLQDERQFGNTSEKDLTTSALNLISLGEKYLHSNGVLRGFDLEDRGVNPNPNNQQIYLTGGLALVNGKFITMNDQVVVIPIIKEKIGATYYNINWALCVNDKGEFQTIPLLDYDPALATPANPNRIFVAYNPNNGATYNLDASTFSNIINNRKDLTILYIVPSVVTTPVVAITLQINDARKYINDVDSNLALRLTSGAAQGNFRNVESILEWIKYNNAFNGTAIVKGALASTTGLLTNPYVFNFSSNVTIDGLSNATLTFSSPITIGSNITFRNLNLIFNNLVSFSTACANVKFENCNITITLPSTPANNVLFNIDSGNDIVFENCNLNVTYTVQATSGAVFRISRSNGFIFNNSDILVSFNIGSSATIVPGDVFTLIGSPNCKITNSSFNGNFSQFVRNTSSNGMYLENLTVRSTYNPSLPANNIFNAVSDPLGITDGLPVVTYAPSNLINSGRGYIYALVTARLSDITIKNVSFLHAPTIASSNRFSFINFELSSASSLLENLSITNCKFTNAGVGGAIDDIRAAIAIINKSPTLVSSFNLPTVSNLVISNNVCNRNQLIALTSQTYSGNMTFTGLLPRNCVIENNICGTIGYWVSSATNTYSLAPSVNNFNDKESSLLITNNSCHLINNIDHTGTYFLASKIVAGATTNMCNYPSGVVTISNNKCNWIHVAIAYEEKSYLQIIDNYLSGYDIAYLGYYDDTTANSAANGTLYSTGYAIFVNSNKHDNSPIPGSPGPGKDSSCLIRGNNTSTGYWVQTAAPPVSYGYYGGGIFCQSSAIISHNIIKGIELFSGVAGISPIYIAGKNNIVTNNQLYRGNVNITSYILYNPFELPAWNASETYGLIVDNTFDSPFIAATNENTISFAATVKNWTVERNKNQTGYALIPLTNGLMPFGSDFSTTPNGFEDFGGPTYWLNVVPTTGGTTGNTYTYKSYVFRIHDDGVPPTVIKLGWQEDLSKYLPSSVRIMALTLGARSFAATIDPVASTIRIDLNKYNTSANAANLNYFTIPATPPPPFGVGVADSNVVNDANSPYNIIFGADLNGTPNTIIKTVDLTNVNSATGAPGGGTDVSLDYMLGKGYNLSTTVNVEIQRNIGAPDLDLYLSPIVVKYRW